MKPAPPANSANQLQVADAFNPGSFGARMVILLHELAHKINPPGFKDDAFSVRDSEKNTQLIMDHCLHAIMGAWKM
jgi:hypothetical protein